MTCVYPMENVIHSNLICQNWNVDLLHRVSMIQQKMVAHSECAHSHPFRD